MKRQKVCQIQFFFFFISCWVVVVSGFWSQCQGVFHLFLTRMVFLLIELQYLNPLCSDYYLDWVLLQPQCGCEVQWELWLVGKVSSLPTLLFPWLPGSTHPACAKLAETWLAHLYLQFEKEAIKIFLCELITCADHMRFVCFIVCSFQKHFCVQNIVYF